MILSQAYVCWYIFPYFRVLLQLQQDPREVFRMWYSPLSFPDVGSLFCLTLHNSRFYCGTRWFSTPNRRFYIHQDTYYWRLNVIGGFRSTLICLIGNYNHSGYGITIIWFSLYVNAIFHCYNPALGKYYILRLLG